MDMSEKLLIVDDEPVMLRLLTMLIKEKTPYEPVITNNPFEALQLAKENGFDLIIADLKMPGLDGAELLEAVKRVHADVPVIIITAYGTTEMAMKILQKGAFDFITKPFKKEQILNAIDKAFTFVRLKKENDMLKDRLKISYN
jgi:DNA-binding NtrC family response regulator